jgi:putative phosphoesterase
MERGLLVERPISPQLIVVGSILRHNSTQLRSGTDDLEFFHLPPAPLNGSGRCPLCSWPEPDDGLLLPVFRQPNRAREGHNFPRADRCCFRRGGSVVEGFENSFDSQSTRHCFCGRRQSAPLVLWSGMMRIIGAISDTHGLLRPQAVAALAGCDPIIHAGDVGSPDVLARLGALAAVHAVRGNVDHAAWSANLPVTQRIEIDGFRIYVLHILAELDPQAADNVDAVIYGHSHQPKIETKNGTLYFNPGSAGPRRFRLPITVGRMSAEHGKLRAEIVELSVER